MDRIKKLGGYFPILGSKSLPPHPVNCLVAPRRLRPPGNLRLATSFDSRRFGSVKNSAFSLVEVTLAIGIIAFALVGIMALFPAATKAALESQRETRATFIAQQILADLTSGPPTNTFLGTSAELAISNNRTPLNLATNNTFVLAYTEEGRFLQTNAPQNFALPNPTASFLTKLTITTNDLPSGLSRVEVLVTAPASATETNRSRYPFITLLRNQ